MKKILKIFDEQNLKIFNERKKNQKIFDEIQKKNSMTFKKIKFSIKLKKKSMKFNKKIFDEKKCYNFL